MKISENNWVLWAVAFGGGEDVFAALKAFGTSDKDVAQYECAAVRNLTFGNAEGFGRAGGCKRWLLR